MPDSVYLLGQVVMSCHLFNPLANMLVNDLKTTKQDWKQFISKRLAADHPLVVAPSSMMIGTVEPGAWNQSKQPTKELFVSNVHPQSHLRLAAVAPKMAFANQDANQESFFELGHGLGRVLPMLFHCQVSRETSVMFHSQVSRGTIGRSGRTWLPYFDGKSSTVSTSSAVSAIEKMSGGRTPE